MAAWIKRQLFHLGVAGLIPRDDSLRKPLGEYARPLAVRLGMIDGTNHAKFVSLVGHISDRFSVVSVIYS